MTKSFSETNIHIIGAGIAGTMLAREIREKGIFGKVIAFLDDDPQKIGKTIDGTPVLGPIEQTARLLRIGAGDEALIAIPSASPQTLRNIYSVLKAAGFPASGCCPALPRFLKDRPTSYRRET